MKNVSVGPFQTAGCSNEVPVVPARYFDCAAYQDCLEIACRKSWRGFECVGCSFSRDNLIEIPFNCLPEDDLWPPHPRELPNGGKRTR